MSMFERTFQCRDKKQFEQVMANGLVDDCLFFMKPFLVEEHDCEYDGPGRYCICDYTDVDTDAIEEYGYFDDNMYVNTRMMRKIE